MAESKFKSQVAAFVADGNTVDGPMPTVDRASTLVWRGKGIRLVFDGDCTLKQTKLLFGGRNGQIRLGEGCTIRGILRADSRCTLTIGAQTRINRVGSIRACEKGRIDIGKNCLFADVIIRNSDLHKVIDLETNERINSADDIMIEDHVWLAENVNVYKGVTVGSGSVVAARSTVLKNVPSNCVAAGTPAVSVRTDVKWSH